MTRSADTVTDIRCWKVRLPFDHGAPPPLFAGRPRSTIDSCWVQLTLHDGQYAAKTLQGQQGE